MHTPYWPGVDLLTFAEMPSQKGLNMTTKITVAKQLPQKCGAAVLALTLCLSTNVAEAAPSVEAALLERIDLLCQRTQFTRTEIRRIQRERDFPVILTNTLEACPGVAAVLTSGATAALPVSAPREKDDKTRDRPARSPDTGNAGY